MMWFDPHAKLAEIRARLPAPHAPAVRPVSQMSRMSQAPRAPDPAPRVADVADVATPRLPKPETFPYGTGCNLGDAPRTWTGRVVSLAEWRSLTEWDKHGPNGRLWNGLTGKWE